MSATPMQYSASKAKRFINFAIAGFLLLIGLPFATVLFDEPGNPLGWAGAAAALGGIAFIVVTLRRNAGRTINLYEDRVELQVRGETRSWRYDAIDGIHIAAGKSFQHGQTYYHVKYYEFLADGARAFTIPPVYANWTDAAQLLTSEVKKRLVARYLQRLDEGQDVQFDLKSANLARGIHLKLDAQGITAGDDGPIPWSTVTKCDFHPNNPGLVAVDTAGKNQVIAFRYYGSTNGMVAADVIRAMGRRQIGAKT